MGYEIDLLKVGEGEKSGDAICLRFGDDLWGSRENQFVMVIDGGTTDSGERLVKHIKNRYGTDTVDLVVSTHPDNDHISGLRVVLNEMTVGRLWMHLPWHHASDFKALFKNRTITSLGLKRQIRASLDTATDLEEIARRKGVPIDEPFSDVQLPFGDSIDVIGPSTSYYTDLLPQFRETPEAREASAGAGFFERAASAVLEAAKTVAESWYIETLSDPAEDATSAENNSSVVLTIRRDNNLLLLTGDAGVPALDRAVDEAEGRGIDLPSLLRKSRTTEAAATLGRLCWTVSWGRSTKNQKTRNRHLSRRLRMPPSTPLAAYAMRSSGEARRGACTRPKKVTSGTTTMPHREATIRPLTLFRFTTRWRNDRLRCLFHPCPVFPCIARRLADRVSHIRPVSPRANRLGNWH
ncbi:MAG: MBL fold metallo-hydrolase [Phycisphaeraceae bacterium]